MEDKVKISDQLGAMAIIDELCHKQQLVDEYVDIPKLREVIAQRIREYYSKQGQAVDDAIIDEGVRQYFARRLQFYCPKLSRTTTFLATVYLNRKKVYAGFAVFLLCFGISFQIYSVRQNTMKRNITEQVEVIQRKWGVLSEFSARKVGAVSCDDLQYAQGSCNLLVSYINEEMLALRSDKELMAVVSATEPAKFFSGHRRTDKQRVASLSELDKWFTQQGSQIDKNATQLTELVKADEQLKNYVATPDFPALRKEFPALDKSVSEAQRQLSSMSVSIPESELSRIGRQIDSISLLKSMQEDVTQIGAKLQKVKLTADEREAIQTQLNQFDQAYKNLNLQSGEQIRTQLTGTLVVAKTPLTLRIVDRQGQKSGVERTYDTSGGKSWYLVVEAVDADNRVMPLTVTNSETGKTQQVNVFAVRVPQQVYEQVKKDKQTDGLIDNAVVATKPSDTLSFNYRISVLPGMITQW